MFKFQLTRALAGLGLVCAFASAHAQPYSQLVVFGDSLADGGNNALLIGTDAAQVISGNTYFAKIPFASGTYSNGPVWTQYLAQSLGVSLAPSIAGGSNYAFGGAQTGANGNDVPQIPGFPFSMLSQLGMYAGSHPGGADPNALYLVSGGGNNIRVALEAIGRGANVNATFTSTVGTYASEMGQLVDGLQALGAQHILVVNTPNFGLTPLASALGANGLASQMSLAMDQALAQRLSGEPGVMSFDFFGFVTQTVTSGAGFSNVTDACGAPSNACDPGTALFYDSIHPTTRGHQLLAQSVLAAVVPEPSQMLLLALGVAALGLHRRRCRVLSSR